MTGDHSDYASPDAWREAAMARPDGVNAAESERRQKQADQHNRDNNQHDPDLLLDQKLFIYGKMEIEEYQAYLLFKHSQAG